jgi:hypothetical protein
MASSGLQEPFGHQSCLRVFKPSLSGLKFLLAGEEKKKGSLALSHEPFVDMSIQPNSASTAALLGGEQAHYLPLGI